MRKLGDQWIENGRMYKAVKPVSKDDNCVGCCFADSRLGHCIGCLQGIIKDLGPVNKDGCLAEERTGKFPFIYHVDSWKDARWMVKLLHEHVLVSVFGDTRQEAIDRWNRRIV